MRSPVTGQMVLDVMGWTTGAPYADYAEEYARRFNAALASAPQLAPPDYIAARLAQFDSLLMAVKMDIAAMARSRECADDDETAIHAASEESLAVSDAALRAFVRGALTERMYFPTNAVS